MLAMRQDAEQRWLSGIDITENWHSNIQKLQIQKPEHKCCSNGPYSSLLDGNTNDKRPSLVVDKQH